MLLSRKEEEVEGEITYNNIKYSPLYDNSLYSEKELETKIQYLK